MGIRRADAHPAISLKGPLRGPAQNERNLWMAELVKVERQEKVAIVTLDHPPVNALSQQLLAELEEL